MRSATSDAVGPPFGCLAFQGREALAYLHPGQAWGFFGRRPGSIFIGVFTHVLNHGSLVLFAAAPVVGELLPGERYLTGNHSQ